MVQNFRCAHYLSTTTHNYLEPDILMFNTKNDRETFISLVNQFAQHCHDNAVSKGFHDSYENVKRILIAQSVPTETLSWFRTIAFQAELARMHSELSEALETARKDMTRPDDHIPSYPNVAVELCDTMIRAFDTLVKWGYPIGEALVAKAEFNSSRPHMHGKNS